MDTGIFAENRSFDVTMEYAKVNPLDILSGVSASKRGPEAATLHLLPTLWFRNTWAWGTDSRRPVLSAVEPTGEANVRLVHVQHHELGDSWLACEGTPELLFTENESNAQRLWSTENRTPFVKDGFHETIVDGARDKVNPQGSGTKAAAHYSLIVEPGATQTILLRLSPSRQSDPFAGAAEVFATRIGEANDFYTAVSTAKTEDERAVQRQALAGLLWSKQFYYYDVDTWLRGDPAGPTPPPQRSRNKGWRHLSNNDIILMPDTWEYPWYAAWDLAFHCIAMAMIDSDFAKDQLLLMLHERYMHPNGQLPAYEWAFGDVNPPVHAWVAWRIYMQEKERTGKGDTVFLERIFQKLMLNFTWWVNRKDAEENNIFEGGFFNYEWRVPEGRTLAGEVRSAVGLLPLLSRETFPTEQAEALLDVRMRGFMETRPYVSRLITRWQDTRRKGEYKDVMMLAMVRGDDLRSLLKYMLDSQEFLSDYGLRAISKYHAAHPYELKTARYGTYTINYEPAESTTGAFGGNSNWRGPIWFPLNFLLVEALQKYHRFYGDDVLVEYPTGSGTHMTLGPAADELSHRLTSIFLRDEQGRRPRFGGNMTFQNDYDWRRYVPFHDDLHGDSGPGAGPRRHTPRTARGAHL